MQTGKCALRENFADTLVQADMLLCAAKSIRWGIDEIKLAVCMHFRALQKFFKLPPFQFRMLLIPDELRRRGNVDGISAHDIVRTNARRIKKIIFINVVKDTDKFALRCRDTEFGACNPLQSILSPFILANAAARDEPGMLRGAIAPVAKQDFVSFVPYDQIDRYERSRLGYFQKTFFINGHFMKCLG